MAREPICCRLHTQQPKLPETVSFVASLSVEASSFVRRGLHRKPASKMRGVASTYSPLSVKKSPAAVIDVGRNFASISRPFKSTFRNLPLDEITLHEQGTEGVQFASSGAVVIDTGIFTGRSPHDKYLVDHPPSSAKISWGEINKPISNDNFQKILRAAINHLESEASKVYIFDGFVGRASKPLKVRVLTENAVQHHFCSNMFITHSQLDTDDVGVDAFHPNLTVMVASKLQVSEWKSMGLHSSTCVAFDMDQGVGVIVGSEYSGEIKKGVFSMLNYKLPCEGVLTMHCSGTRELLTAENVHGDRVALFFGLSGTGKTTLSSDDSRALIGDDEIGWDGEGTFNLEGGCYAKVIDLSAKAEPLIYHAIRKGTVLENVVLDEKTKDAIYDDHTRTENTRAAYDLSFIEGHVPHLVRNGHPIALIFLTCDAFGVLPPVSRLSGNSALYHFISGFSAKVAGTERGVASPQPTFSPMYGGAFMPLRPEYYAELLRSRLRAHPHISVWLVNSGWSGGPYGKGRRFPLKVTRRIVAAIISGELESAEYEEDKLFRLSIPKSVQGVETSVLFPRTSWNDPVEYDKAAKHLAMLFRENWTDRGYPKDLEEYGPRV